MRGVIVAEWLNKGLMDNPQLWHVFGVLAERLDKGFMAAWGPNKGFMAAWGPTHRAHLPHGHLHPVVQEGRGVAIGHACIQHLHRERALRSDGGHRPAAHHRACAPRGC
eukprot:3916724-Pyramimonas_sp.AAC.1